MARSCRRHLKALPLINSQQLTLPLRRILIISLSQTGVLRESTMMFHLELYNIELSLCSTVRIALKINCKNYAAASFLKNYLQVINNLMYLQNLLTFPT